VGWLNPSIYGQLKKEKRLSGPLFMIIIGKININIREKICGIIKNDVR
jgi:hypothetical protein